jgi:hypothetical protein
MNTTLSISLRLLYRIIAAFRAAVDVEADVVSTPHALSALISSLRDLVLSRTEPEDQTQSNKRHDKQQRQKNACEVFHFSLA